MRDWKALRQAKLDQLDAKIPAGWRIAPTDEVNVIEVPSQCGLLTADELVITSTSAAALVNEMKAGRRSSFEVTAAFCKRAAVAHQLTRCLTDAFFDEAMATARAIDEEFARTGRPLGPLHGLPVSLKDCMNIRGKDSTIGFAVYVDEPMTEETEITMIMRECGAVLFCKTNVPTGMMSSETYNNVFGYTMNPYNRSLTSGGSSGGEGALLAMKGAPLGVGSDAGGSIRIPAAFCNLYGLKASYGRFPSIGQKAALKGQEAIKATIGPMSTSLDAIEMWAKAVVTTEPWTRDPNVLPIPWRPVSVPEKLCFGIMRDNSLVRPLPPITRGLDMVKTALEAAGHNVIEFDPYDPLECWRLQAILFTGDGGASISSLLGQTGEPWPRVLSLYADAHEKAKDNPPLTADMWKAQAERATYAKGALDAWMRARKKTGTGRPMDALISPVAPCPSAPHYKFSNYSYTLMWNILDQPACTFPVTVVDPATDAKSSCRVDARNDSELDIWNDCELDSIGAAYKDRRRAQLPRCSSVPPASRSPLVRGAFAKAGGSGG